MRAALMAALLSATLLLAAGCTGDGESAAFQRAFADDPSVESMKLTSHDNQPFTGGVSGEVVAREALADEDFAALVGRIGDYTRENGDRMQGRVSLVVDGFEMEVTGDEGHDDEAVGLLLALRADARVISATVGDSSLVLVGSGTAEAVELARDLPALRDEVAPGLPDTATVRAEDGDVDLRGSTAARGDALRLWDALTAEVPLAGLRARNEPVVVVALRDESDLSAARRVAAGVALGPGTSVRFASDVVRLGDSDGEDARLLLSSLDEELRDRIAYVWISGARVQVAVRIEADLAGMADAVDAALPARITDASMVLESDPATSLSVRDG
ncbi:hypothetical protein GCM10022202_02540 [Microbacterium marinilacus]|uniref:GerMN domain-containing protein n=1 Tax=Microbacterium marinilacus TaxID=415209 RepID=A0ABP7B225_9MICO